MQAQPGDKGPYPHCQGQNCALESRTVCQLQSGVCVRACVRACVCVCIVASYDAGSERKLTEVTSQLWITLS